LPPTRSERSWHGSELLGELGAPWPTPYHRGRWAFHAQIVEAADNLLLSLFRRSAPGHAMQRLLRITASSRA
jgi:hypothetical protein